MITTVMPCSFILHIHMIYTYPYLLYTITGYTSVHVYNAPFNTRYTTVHFYNTQLRDTDFCNKMYRTQQQFLPKVYYYRVYTLRSLEEKKTIQRKAHL